MLALYAPNLQFAWAMEAADGGPSATSSVARSRPEYRTSQGSSIPWFSGLLILVSGLLLIVITICVRGWAQQSSANQDSQQQQCSQMPGMQMSCPKSQRQQESEQHSGMKRMDHKNVPNMQMNMGEMPKNFVEAIKHHGTSGTSAEPNSAPQC